MIINYVEEDIPIIGSGTHHRSPGLHLSDVIKSMVKYMGTYKDKAQNWDKGPTFAVGYIWEEVVSQSFAALAVNPAFRIGSVIHDGIIMTPDAYNWEVGAIEEYKATWRSIKTTPRDIWEWMVQGMGYCWACSTHSLIMRILYLNGDYRGSGPKYIRADITFTEQEMRENWAMVLNHAKYMKEKADENGS